MSIKSDKWIKKMSLEEGMIEPCSDNQVRVDPKGNKLISYGVSSFGYDVRCSNEFKVFTNIHSVTVDPKQFDDNSFIDIHADSCSYRHGYLLSVYPQIGWGRQGLNEC